MRRNITNTKDGNFVFREVRTPGELLEVFKLRYGVYQQSRLSEFCRRNDEMIDVDAWDSRSRHFVLYHHSSGNRKLAGTMRVINNRLMNAAFLMGDLAQESQFICELLRAQPSHPYPMLSYGDESKVCQKHVEVWKSESSQVVEVSRLAVNPEFRFTEVVMHLAESTLALGFFGRYNVDYAIFNCSTTHKRFYRRYGFLRIAGTTDSFWTKPGARGCALVCTPHNVPSSIAGNLVALAEEFDLNGQVCYRSNTKSDEPIRTFRASGIEVLAA